MADRITIIVSGVPQAQGSKIAGVTRDGRAFMREANDKTLRPWRRAVRDAARAVMVDRGPLLRPYRLSAEFVFPTVVSEPDRWGHDVKPDLSHLVRAIEDALTDAKVWADDAQVVEYGAVVKRDAAPGEEPGVRLVVESLAQLEWTLRDHRRARRKANR